ncbi:MAG: hypothetical protein ACXWUL_11790 [Caldimonas sp.]
MALRELVFGEKSITKVAALYATAAAADSARARLLGKPGWSGGQVVGFTPADAKKSRRGFLARGLEPESGGIFRTILRAHAFTAIIGLVAGILLWAALYWGGVSLITSSATVSFIAIVFFATASGMMWGGLISLRPDHAQLITVVRDALHAGRWAVVAHPLDEQQAGVAEEALRADSIELQRTL